MLMFRILLISHEIVLIWFFKTKKLHFTYKASPATVITTDFIQPLIPDRGFSEGHHFRDFSALRRAFAHAESSATEAK